MGEFRPSLPGERRGGRAKGTPNKADATIKSMVITALNHVGGAMYLAEQAQKNPTAFMSLVGKVLPLQLTGPGENGALMIDFRWADATPPEPKPAPVVIDAEPERTDADDSEQIVIAFDVPEQQ